MVTEFDVRLGWMEIKGGLLGAGGAKCHSS